MNITHEINRALEILDDPTKTNDFARSQVRLHLAWLAKKIQFRRRTRFAPKPRTTLTASVPYRRAD
jgi:hypothetical protein